MAPLKPAIPVPGTTIAIGRFQFASSTNKVLTISNYFFWNVAAQQTTANQQVLADNWKAALQGRLIPLMSNEISLIQYAWKDLRAVTNPTVISTAGLPTAGGVAGPSIPADDALCLTIRSPLSSKNGRGRRYIPGLPLSVLLNAQHFTTAGANAMASAFGNAMIDVRGTLAGAGLSVSSVIVSRQQGRVYGTAVVTPIGTPETTYVSARSSQISTQRRRSLQHVGRRR